MNRTLPEEERGRDIERVMVQEGGIVSRISGIEGLLEMPRGLGMGYQGRAESRGGSGAGAGSVERRGYPENSTCPWAVGLESEG